MGAERKGHYVTAEAKKMTAYHEGGHALVALLTPGAMPLHKVTVLPRGQALGIVSLSCVDNFILKRIKLTSNVPAPLYRRSNCPRWTETRSRRPSTSLEVGPPTRFLVLSPPEADSFITRPLAVDVAMGGRVAEELIYGKENVTSGAHSDLVAASDVANGMVKSMGFSDKVGLVAHGDESVHLSERKKDEIESEVRRSVPCPFYLPCVNEWWNVG